jgi:acyl-CoA thioesterase-2
VDRLTLTPTGDDRFEGAPGRDPAHLFGGQLGAQALLGAANTVNDDLDPQVLTAHFLRAGRGDEPVTYQVERTWAGSTFASRRVLASQGDDLLFTATVAFHRPEGTTIHQTPLARWAGSPEGRPAGRYDSVELDCRDVPRRTAGSGHDGIGPDDDRNRLGHWATVRGEWPEPTSGLEARRLHQAAVVWMSDTGSTRAARQPHLDHPGFARRQTTSLNHTVWFQAPTRADHWHFVDLVSVATAGSRGLVTGTIHDGGGRLVASLAQQVLVRLPAG